MEIALRITPGKVSTECWLFVVAVQKNTVLLGLEKRLKCVVNSKS